MLLDRLNALVWTCAIEIPIYTWWLRDYFEPRNALIASALVLQLATEPLVWQFTQRAPQDRAVLWLAECGAALSEVPLLCGLFPNRWIYG